MYIPFERRFKTNKQIRGINGWFIAKRGLIKWYDVEVGEYRTGRVNGINGDDVSVTDDEGRQSVIHRTAIKAIKSKAELPSEEDPNADPLDPYINATEWPVLRSEDHFDIIEDPSGDIYSLTTGISIEDMHEYVLGSRILIDAGVSVPSQEIVRYGDDLALNTVGEVGHYDPLAVPEHAEEIILAGRKEVEYFAGTVGMSESESDAYREKVKEISRENDKYGVTVDDDDWTVLELVKESQGQFYIRDNANWVAVDPEVESSKDSTVFGRVWYSISESDVSVFDSLILKDFVTKEDLSTAILP